MPASPPAWLSAPALLALLAAAGYGAALVATAFGLRHRSAAAGAAISIPVTALAFWLLAPWFLPPLPWPPAALAIFAAVGVFFPALVTVLTFAANARMGPSVTGALGATTPFFAVTGSVLVLGEAPGALKVLGLAAIVLGVASLSWRPGDAVGSGGAAARWPLWLLALPLAAALLRGLAQTAIKAALALAPSPFLGGLVGYTVSAAVIGLLSAARRGSQPPAPAPRQGRLPFVVAGLLNGGAVLLTYSALKLGTVAVVAPVVATSPLFALGLGALLLRGERLTPAMLAGVLLTVLGVVLLLLRPMG